MLARICLWAPLLASAALAADESPYAAYVVADGVDVVAGPGHRFYATDRLSRGTKVEIYREEPSGWLAIRPPEGSFSWTPAEFVERLEDGETGRVKEAVGSWIGTAVEQASEHRQEVTLKAGEVVRILGEKTVTTKSGKPAAWLKIAPPAGEYRWIHLRDVSRQPPVDAPPVAAALASATSAKESPVGEASAGERSDQDRPTPLAAPLSSRRTLVEPARVELPGQPLAIRSLDPPASPVGTGVALAQYQGPATNPRPSLSPDGFVPRKRRAEDNGAPATTPLRSTTSVPARPAFEPTPRVATATRPQSLATPAATPLAGGLSSVEIARQLDQLELELSLMLAQDRAQWNLAAIKERVNTLVEKGADPAARGRARLLLDKMKQFEDAFHVPTSPASRAAAAPLATGDGAEKNERASDPLSDPHYDAQGWLKPVVSRRGDKPAAPYAVVDAEGQPLCFVSPSPGLNLNRYLNQQVGLYGRRGYLEQLKKPHVLAERVIALDSSVR